jgi:hypothetical protein
MAQVEAGWEESGISRRVRRPPLVEFGFVLSPHGSSPSHWG